MEKVNTMTEINYKSNYETHKHIVCNCPLCGSGNLKIKRESTHGHDDSGFQNLRIFCSDCTCSIGDEYGYGDPSNEDIAKVVAQWNSKSEWDIKVPEVETFEHFEILAGQELKIATLINPLFAAQGVKGSSFYIDIDLIDVATGDFVIFPYKTFEGVNLKAMVIGVDMYTYKCKFLSEDREYHTQYTLPIGTKLPIYRQL